MPMNLIACVAVATLFAAPMAVAGSETAEKPKWMAEDPNRDGYADAGAEDALIKRQQEHKRINAESKTSKRQAFTDKDGDGIHDQLRTRTRTRTRTRARVRTNEGQGSMKRGEHAKRVRSGSGEAASKRSKNKKGSAGKQGR